ALAEIVFPPSMTLHQAKQYVYQQLEQLPVDTRCGRPSWVEEADRLLLRLTADDAPRHEAVALAAGVRELVGVLDPSADGAGPVAWQTCCLEFDRAVGWQRPRAEEWVRKHLEVRDLGRTAFLTAPHRMRPELTAVVSGVLGPPAYQVSRPAGTTTAVE